MSFKDRVYEVSTTTGTDDFALDGAFDATYQSFAVYGTDPFDYSIVDDVNGAWEVGGGTYSNGVLARTTVYDSSNSGNKVNFGAGIKKVISGVSAKTLASYPQSEYTDLGDVSGTVDIDLDDYSDGDSIAFNATADADINFVGMPALNRAIDLHFWGMADEGSAAVLDFLQTIGWSGYQAPVLDDSEDQNTSRFSVKLINANGTLKIEGDKGALFLGVEADQSAVTFNPSDTSPDVGLVNNNKSLTPYRTSSSYRQTVSRSFATTQENDPKIQLTVRIEDGYNMGMNFGLATMGLPLESSVIGANGFKESYIGSVVGGMCIVHTKSSSSSYRRTAIVADGVEVMAIPYVDHSAGEKWTILFDPSTGNGWVVRNDVIVSGAATDPETNTAPHFTIATNVNRAFAVSATQSTAQSTTQITLISEAESNTTVTDYPSFAYAKV